MKTLKNWGTGHKVRAGDRSLGVYGSRGIHVLRKNLSSQESQTISVNANNNSSQGAAPSQINVGVSMFAKLKKSPSSSSLHQLFPAHQTITPLLTTNLTMGLLSNRSFAKSSSSSDQGTIIPNKATSKFPPFF